MEKSKFIPPNNDHSYYPLLYKALDYFKGEDYLYALELGTGHGSTQLMHDFITKSHDAELHSFDEKQVWLDKFIHLRAKDHTLELITDWRTVKKQHPEANVIFIDHAPGEDRKQMILDFADSKGILVIHDTEPAADHGYQMRQHWGLFKYKVEVKTSGAWATALSNEIDITKWVGEEFGEYKISL